MHEQHSEADCSVTSVSGTVVRVDPWATLAAWENPLKDPSPSAGKPEPVPPGRLHEHDACWASLFLMPVEAKATAESPRRMSVCFILSNLLNNFKIRVLYDYCY